MNTALLYVIENLWVTQDQKDFPVSHSIRCSSLYSRFRDHFNSLIITVIANFSENQFAAFTGSSSLQRQSESSNCWKGLPCIELKSIWDPSEACIKVLSSMVQIFKCWKEQTLWKGERIINGSLKLETLRMSIEGRLGFCQRGIQGRLLSRKKTARTTTLAW